LYTTTTTTTTKPFVPSIIGACIKIKNYQGLKSTWAFKDLYMKNPMKKKIKVSS